MSITAQDLFDDLTKVIGANAEAKGVAGWLDTHLPELNIAISGNMDNGFPQGRMIEIFGPASSGKTFISTLAMRAVQEQGGIAFFSDHERSFEPVFAERLGLDISPSVFRHLRPRTFEDSIEAFKKAVPMVRDKGFNKPMIWVFDSVAAMIPRSKLLDDKGKIIESAEYNMRDKLALATCCSQNYPILKAFAEDYNCTVILLNQIRINPGQMFGDPTTTPGGNAAEFYADVRLSLGKKDLKDDNKEVAGFQITAKAVKNKLARPFRQAIWQVKFDEERGVLIDTIASNLDFAIRKGLVQVEGSRVVWEGSKLFAKKLIENLRNDPNGNQKLLDLIRNGGTKVTDTD